MRKMEIFTAGKGRQLIKKLYLLFINAHFKTVGFVPTRKRCVVFAPHQDDETLGCGGTIIQKIRQGACVKVVYMTDGNNSHKYAFPDDLRDVRHKEALAACAILGIAEEDVIFLNNEDGKLTENISCATTQILKILGQFAPQEIYVPYIGDHHPDHKATNKAVIAAINKAELTTTVFEYPTWFWDHWPIVELKSKSRKEFLTYIRKTTIKSLFNILKDLRCSVLVSHVVNEKQHALSQHQSQLCRMNDQDNWFILGDVSNGEWLARFSQNREVFFRHTYCFKKS